MFIILKISKLRVVAISKLIGNYKLLPYKNKIDLKNIF